MNEKISALMDGELDAEEAARIIKTLAADDTRRGDWDTYHLIGACLRGEAGASRPAATDAIFAQLAAEPTVLAPGALAAKAGERRTRIALAMAASIVTFSAVSVIALKQQAGVTVAPMQAIQATAPLAVAVGAATKESEGRVNDYLVIHRQFANHAAYQNASAVRNRDLASQDGSRPARDAAGR